ncbi:MAG: DUF4465 domain-containing protein [Paludibacteraceae bacterium]|nr:DUF4465 domain-containing protein [Paludibacteraceae bacterium]
MKKSILFVAALALAMGATAETYKMGWSTLSGMPNYAPHYENDVWDQLYNDSTEQFISFNEGKMLASHLPGGNSYDGMSWEGFTLSRVASDSISAYACMDKGGVAGEGSPFLVGYFSEYYVYTNEEELPSSNIIYFDSLYYPVSLSVNQITSVYENLLHGNAYSRAFTENDTLRLIIAGLTEDMEASEAKVIVPMAEGTTFLQHWQEVDLSSLGQCVGLVFTMTSTDMSYGMMNTPAYFALDGVTISSEPASVEERALIAMNWATVEGNTLQSSVIEFTADGVWSNTYDDFDEQAFIVDDRFAFYHLMSGNSWGGMSWEGFTISKKATDTDDQFACAAKGGLAGEGSPFVVGYFSEYYVMPQMGVPSNCIVALAETYYPTEISICQSARTLSSLQNGDTYARAFTEQDTLTLHIQAIDAKLNVLKQKDYVLAAGRDFNTGWETVDLSELGACNGLAFTMSSTDVGLWGINTPTYFALDGLTISTEAPQIEEAVEAVEEEVRATKELRNGRVVIRRGEQLYDITGQVIR